MEPSYKAWLHSPQESIMKKLSDIRSFQNSYPPHDSVAELELHMLRILKDSDSFDTLAPCNANAAAIYHLGTGGQRIRAVLALHAGRCLGLTLKDTQALALACELVHNASLIHDDLHDRDAYRRGQPSVWNKFGDEVAICAGDLLISASYFALSQIEDVARVHALFALMHARISNAIRGQCADLSRPKNRAATIGDYKNIALTKSGALLSLPTELALLAGGQDMFLILAREAALAFSIAYQIHDDLADAVADAARSPIRSSTTNSIADNTACNVVFILQSDSSCIDAKMEAKKIGLQQLALAASACTDLPLNSGSALYAMCLQLKDELECIE